MKLFVDTANLTELDTCLRRGFPSGVTTNPAILAKEERCDFREHIRKMIDLIMSHGYKIPLSVEVFTAKPSEMISQAELFIKEFGHYPDLNIKIPIGWDELGVIAELTKRGIPVNCTCCMSYNQAMIAAQAGARFVSLFWGRIRDIGYDSGTVVRGVTQSLKASGLKSEVIVGSIRHIADINEAIQAGTDIVTVPPKFFPQLCKHPKTDEAVREFVTEFEKWNSEESVVPFRKAS